LATGDIVNELSPALVFTPLTVTVPTPCAVGYAWHVSSSTHTLPPPQGVSQNGTRGVVNVHAPSTWGFSQMVVAGVGPSLTLPTMLVVASPTLEAGVSLIWNEPTKALLSPAPAAPAALDAPEPALPVAPAEPEGLSLEPQAMNVKQGGRTRAAAAKTRQSVFT
jgi:hypothetical protein